MIRCARCGHSPDWHRLDDSTNVSPVDPAAEFRCLGYDCEKPGPVPPGGRACDCPDYENPANALTKLWDGPEYFGGAA